MLRLFLVFYKNTSVAINVLTPHLLGLHDSLVPRRRMVQQVKGESGWVRTATAVQWYGCWNGGRFGRLSQSGFWLMSGHLGFLPGPHLCAQVHSAGDPPAWGESSGGAIHLRLSSHSRACLQGLLPLHSPLPCEVLTCSPSWSVDFTKSLSNIQLAFFFLSFFPFFSPQKLINGIKLRVHKMTHTFTMHWFSTNPFESIR